ncbi:MAG TPA: hypothetical protein VFQ91_17225 [Bryobacteraceae bacterium]|nr:hypothetical protein [Bryobacteraceae bacterium]
MRGVASKRFLVFGLLLLLCAAFLAFGHAGLPIDLPVPVLMAGLIVLALLPVQPHTALRRAEVLLPPRAPRPPPVS